MFLKSLENFEKFLYNSLYKILFMFLPILRKICFHWCISMSGLNIKCKSINRLLITMSPYGSGEGTSSLPPLCFTACYAKITIIYFYTPSTLIWHNLLVCSTLEQHIYNFNNNIKIDCDWWMMINFCAVYDYWLYEYVQLCMCFKDVKVYRYS